MLSAMFGSDALRFARVLRRLIAPLLWLSLLGLAACGGTPEPCYVVSGDQARAMLGPGTILLDVRTPEQHRLGPIEGSVHIPLEELSYRMRYVATHNRIVVIAESDGRARRAAEQLRAAGYEVFELGGVERLRSTGERCAP
jgi:rhodanese-related sulfurtransferase